MTKLVTGLAFDIGQRDISEDRVAAFMCEGESLANMSFGAVVDDGERDMLAGRPPGFWQRLFGSGQKQE